MVTVSLAKQCFFVVSHTFLSVFVNLLSFAINLWIPKNELQAVFCDQQGFQYESAAVKIRRLLHVNSLSTLYFYLEVAPDFRHNMRNIRTEHEPWIRSICYRKTKERPNSE